MNSSAELLKELRIDRRPGAVTRKRRWPWFVGGAIVLVFLLLFLMGGRPVVVETAKARSAAEGGPASVLDASGYVRPAHRHGVVQDHRQGARGVD